MRKSSTLIELEKELNERWSVGDPTGYFDAFADDMTYFDPMLQDQLFGKEAVIAYIRTLYRNPGITRTEYLNPSVVASDADDLAVLSYNMKNYVTDEAGNESILRRWNTTEVYRVIDAQWRIVHSNWSLTSAVDITVI